MPRQHWRTGSASSRQSIRVRAGDPTVKWTAADIPDQTGKTAVVTGANSGIGFHTALELARAGARVVVAVRDEVTGKAAIRRPQAEVPDADLHLGLLDLADLGSVRHFAAQVLDSNGRPDLLVNSANPAAVSDRRTADATVAGSQGPLAFRPGPVAAPGRAVRGFRPAAVAAAGVCLVPLARTSTRALDLLPCRGDLGHRGFVVRRRAADLFARVRRLGGASRAISHDSGRSQRTLFRRLPIGSSDQSATATHARECQLPTSVGYFARICLS